jgi:restriction system protein
VQGGDSARTAPTPGATAIAEKEHMATSSQAKGPEFVKYFGPVIEALKALGGSGRPTEVKEWIAEHLGISEAEASEAMESGASRFGNRVNWARFYLSKAGHIDSSTRGVWSLTDSGWSYALSQKEAVDLFKRVHAVFATERTAKRGAMVDIAPDPQEALAPVDGYRAELLRVLRDLPAKGFENLCQGLLREAGFESVTVTGKSGDGGIDGIGMLQMNSLVSFKVLFQCKRYAGSIGPDKIRDFRGAMMGRADKGIVLTTGSFTADARKEAVRDGVPAIELVDSEKLLDMMEQLEFGLRPKQTYEVDRDFFTKYA